MLTQEQNDRYSRVGAGTPMGELMRRWWHPVAATAELLQRPTKAVRLLGEDLVLYRTPSGEYGTTAQRCPHRAMDMLYGIPEQEGLRCAYHGWLFNFEGQCVEQPAEPPNSRFKDKVRIAAYPAQELGGLIWTYLGPAPVPLLPRWDLLVWDNVEREISTTILPCNWLQCVDNGLDQTHVEWLHGYYGSYAAHQAGRPWQEMDQGHHYRIGFDRFDYGIIKRRATNNSSEKNEAWSMGHPMVLPGMLRVGAGGSQGQHVFLIRVPIDDENTWHIRYRVQVPDPGVTVPQPDVVPWETFPIYGDDGRILDDTVPAQDILAWIGQGSITERTIERLGVGDVGLLMWRKLLEDQLQEVAAGRDPLCVIRDPKINECIVLPQDRGRYPTEDYLAAAHAWDNPGAAEREANLDSVDADMKELSRTRLYERRATHGATVE